MKTLAKSFICIITISLLCGFLSAKEICLTFDKLPYMEPLGFWTPREVSNLILRVMKRHNIPAAGFVVEEKIDDTPSSYIVLQDWVEAGHIIGNNTYAYVDLNEVDIKDFLSHVADGQKFIRRAARGGVESFRFFRYPMLHEGNTEKKKKDVAKRLYQGDYQHVPATVVTSDYEFNHFVHDADDAEMALLKNLYLDHVKTSIGYSEKQSDKVFGRQVKHILQLHLGIGTASFFEDLVILLKERGYSFISVREALEDSAYEEEESYVGPLGLSFIDRVAVTKGIPVDETVGQISRSQIRKRLEEGPIAPE